MGLDPGQIITLVAVAISTGLTLVALGAAWGTLRAKVDGINDRLDRMNGRQDRLDTTQIQQGKQIVRLEGLHRLETTGD